MSQVLHRFLDMWPEPAQSDTVVQELTGCMVFSLSVCELDESTDHAQRIHIARKLFSVCSSGSYLLPALEFLYSVGDTSVRNLATKMLPAEMNDYPSVYPRWHR